MRPFLVSKFCSRTVLTTHWTTEAAGKFAIEKITKLTNAIYSTGIVSENMKESEFIVIPKKNGADDCSKHRTISIKTI